MTAHDQQSLPSSEQRERILGERTRELARRARSLAPRDPTASGEPFLVCAVGRNRYGLRLPAVAAVLAWRPCTPAAQAGGAAIGLFAHEGRTISALDLAALLGLPVRDETSPGCFVLLKGGEPRIALRVDDALAVAALKADDTAGGLATDEGSAFATGYAPMAGAAGPMLVALLDLDRVLRPFAPILASGV
ncbi:hypothetical protein GCM10007036_00430 [Alsobacter metallidurans]|uniref:CheW-like domain-containing protein n=1 Tax=Alsobacter metallidurans TaxID=340221 RepID=A0A917I3D1_9HYPH|nr:chemotaxis protein CheW [Alsobacter metallidurans]GGH06173.1 hypothetical protein GCM10007036_00430 [Alsobacter metallidurans]